MTEHPIPDAALETDIATLAQKGAGKTYLNKGLVERLLGWDRRVVIMDPLNVWWGLQARADGSPGFPITVIGGPNGDIALDPAKGTELGAYVAGAQIQAVVDVSELKSGELVAFATAFFAELYRLNRDPLWLVLEEADVFAPQNPQGLESFMLHEVDRIARRGRQRGFRLWTICQRPQQLNKKALSQTSTMVLMRLRAPQDRKAAEAWMLGHGDKATVADISAQLASLKTGEGWLWAPDLDILKCVSFPPIATLDTSRTPQAGDARPAEVRLAKPDLGTLAALLTPADGARSGPGEKASVPGLEAAEERGYRRGRLEGIAEGRAEITALFSGLRAPIDALKASVSELLASAGPIPAAAAQQSSEPEKSLPAPPEDGGPRTPPVVARKGAPHADVVRTNPSPAGNPSGAMGLLRAAAQVHPARMTWGQIASLAGRKPTGGHFNASRKTALDQGWLIEAEGAVAVTAAGLAAAGVEPRKGALADVWAEALPQPAAKMFAVIREHPGVTAIGLATVLNVQPRGGHWNNGMATLKRNGLVRFDGERMHLVDWLTEVRDGGGRGAARAGVA